MVKPSAFIWKLVCNLMYKLLHGNKIISMLWNKLLQWNVWLTFIELVMHQVFLIPNFRLTLIFDIILILQCPPCSPYTLWFFKRCCLACTPSCFFKCLVHFMYFRCSWRMLLIHWWVIFGVRKVSIYIWNSFSQSIGLYGYTYQ